MLSKYLVTKALVPAIFVCVHTCTGTHEALENCSYTGNSEGRMADCALEVALKQLGSHGNLEIILDL